MNILKNMPILLSVGKTLVTFRPYKKKIDRARLSGDIEWEKREIADATFAWAKDVAKRLKMDVETFGRENLPDHDGLVFISNHQGYGDIIALFIALEGREISFMAKDSLTKVPYLGDWIKTIRGLFIKRGNAKEALRSIKEGSEFIKSGFNLVIFPEGTRSRSSEMGEFKGGSFKLATKAKATIVPVTIDGSYHVYEEFEKVMPAKVRVTIHQPIDTGSLDRKELAEMEKKVALAIESAIER